MKNKDSRDLAYWIIDNRPLSVEDFIFTTTQSVS